MRTDLGIEVATLDVAVSFPVDDVEIQFGIGYIEIPNVHLARIPVSKVHELLENFRRQLSFKRVIRTRMPRGNHN